jgi:DNA repair exonuclease SbcCD ATPase subunit
MDKIDTCAREIAELFGHDFDALDQVKKHDLDRVLCDNVADPTLIDNEIVSEYDELETALSERGLLADEGMVKTWTGYLKALDKIAEHLGEGQLTHVIGDDQCPAMLLAETLEEKLLELGNKINDLVEEIQELEKEARKDVTGLVSETDMEEYRAEMADLRTERDQLAEDLEQAHARREALESELAKSIGVDVRARCKALERSLAEAHARREALESKLAEVRAAPLISHVEASLSQVERDEQAHPMIMVTAPAATPAQLAALDQAHAALKAAVAAYQTVPAPAPVDDGAMGIELMATRKVLCALAGETTDAAATKLIEALRKTEQERNTLRAELKARIQDTGAPADIARQLTEYETEITKLRDLQNDLGRQLNEQIVKVDGLVRQLRATTIDRDKYADMCHTLTLQQESERSARAERKAEIIQDQEESAAVLKAVTTERDELARQVSVLTVSPDPADLAPGHAAEVAHLGGQIAELTTSRDELARQLAAHIPYGADSALIDQIARARALLDAAAGEDLITAAARVVATRRPADRPSPIDPVLAGALRG